MDNTKLYESDVWKSSKSLEEKIDNLINKAKFFDDPILKRELIECSHAITENLEGAYRNNPVNMAFLTNALSFVRGLENNLKMTKVKMYISKETFEEYKSIISNLDAEFKDLIHKCKKTIDFV